MLTNTCSNAFAKSLRLLKWEAASVRSTVKSTLLALLKQPRCAAYAAVLVERLSSLGAVTQVSLSLALSSLCLSVCLSRSPLSSLLPSLLPSLSFSHPRLRAPPLSLSLSPSLCFSPSLFLSLSLPLSLSLHLGLLLSLSHSLTAAAMQAEAARRIMEKARSQYARAAGSKRGAAKRQMDPRLAAGGDAIKRARVAEAALIPLEVPQTGLGLSAQGFWFRV